MSRPECIEPHEIYQPKRYVLPAGKRPLFQRTTFRRPVETVRALSQSEAARGPSRQQQRSWTVHNIRDFLSSSVLLSGSEGMRVSMSVWTKDDDGDVERAWYAMRRNSVKRLTTSSSKPSRQDASSIKSSTVPQSDLRAMARDQKTSSSMECTHAKFTPSRRPKTSSRGRNALSWFRLLPLLYSDAVSHVIAKPQQQLYKDILVISVGPIVTFLISQRDILHINK